MLALLPASGLQASQCLEPDQEAEPLQRTMPAYPHPAVMMCLDGEVLLELTIGEQGLVDDVAVLESQPPGVFDGAARRAVDGWTYLPECTDGRPGTTTVKTLIDFKFQDLSLDVCPDGSMQLDEPTLTLLGEIGALYALTAESQLDRLPLSRIEDDLTHATEPALGRDALRVWRYHHDLLLESMEITQTTHRRLGELGFPMLVFQQETFKTDPGLTQTQAELGTMRDALDAHIRRLEEMHQKMQARRAALDSTTEFDQQTLALLTDAFAGRLNREVLDKRIGELEEQFRLISEMVDLFVREQAHWPGEGNDQYFDDPDAQASFIQLGSKLFELELKMRESHLRLLRGFEEYSLSD